MCCAIASNRLRPRLTGQRQPVQFGRSCHCRIHAPRTPARGRGHGYQIVADGHTYVPTLTPRMIGLTTAEGRLIQGFQPAPCFADRPRPGQVRRWAVHDQPDGLILGLVRTVQPQPVAGAGLGGHRRLRHGGGRSPCDRLPERQPPRPGRHRLGRVRHRHLALLRADDARRGQNGTAPCRRRESHGVVSCDFRRGRRLSVRPLPGTHHESQRPRPYPSDPSQSDERCRSSFPRVQTSHSRPTSACRPSGRY